jgi:hypothetical protein
VVVVGSAANSTCGFLASSFAGDEFAEIEGVDSLFVVSVGAWLFVLLTLLTEAFASTRRVSKDAFGSNKVTKYSFFLSFPANLNPREFLFSLFFRTCTGASDL